MQKPIDRRKMLQGSAALSGAALLSPAWAMSGHHGLATSAGTLSGPEIALSIGASAFKVGTKLGHAITVNNSLPAPLIRLKEGQNVKLAVTNSLKEDSSIHWHGLLLPFQYDGVPGISFPGIKPGQTFTYEFPIKQSGTYWYHSHSNMQEAMGLYGAIIIDPAAPDPVRYDREHVLILADWSFTHPHKIYQNNRKMAGYYNKQKQTLAGLLKGKDQSADERKMWAQMRMDPTDISDVTGSTYHYLINGQDSLGNWTGLFAPGERVRLRIINASAMSNFNIRIPGLAMTVVQADGQNIKPVETDEFQIAVAETYDVIVEPKEALAYGFIAEAIDRSGQCRATLAPRIGMVASIPALRDRPLLTMKDMGMEVMPDMDHGAMGHDMADMKMLDPSVAPQVKMGPGVATLAPMPIDRTGERPTGLEKVDHRVLTYRDLKPLVTYADVRTPEREIDVHLTANMERYMWSFDGVKFSDKAEPLAFRHNERVRVNLINDTMMPHPIHLHGHFFDVVTSTGEHPRKHTVNVLPGGKVSFDLTADAYGDWAFHCHMLMHMHSGMFRVVTVRKDEDAA
jgi:CopA family copper-resistance protein